MVRKLLRVRARPCWGKCVLKMGMLGRPGHAVSLFGKSFGSEVMKTRKAAKPFFFRGSGCNETGLEEMRPKNGSVEAARPCCSPAGAVWLPSRGFTVLSSKTMVFTAFVFPKLCFLFVKLPKPHQNIAKPCFCAFCTC